MGRDRHYKARKRRYRRPDGHHFVRTGFLGEEGKQRDEKNDENGVQNAPDSSDFSALPQNSDAVVRKRVIEMKINSSYPKFMIFNK